ncbi:hypothetical protein Pr1d_50560 [Bythopirellula goksoeyrii]|uniref:Uncharacterized protein n=1 Tax=Bythopirellula goksoeyrii TaxID=1400387 RepID=A0A5B9QJF1_9BACT|nr:hypothetical protein Pr1d_50560 [Bythopirellula goksoeyrii]
MQYRIVATMRVSICSIRIYVDCCSPDYMLTTMPSGIAEGHVNRPIAKHLAGLAKTLRDANKSDSAVVFVIEVNNDLSKGL